MGASSAINAALWLAAVGGLALAILLWRHASAGSGARPLGAFLVVVGAWASG
ncbi:hypothetical protein [Rhodomicrobium sp.]|uniref:hypothetical protein n=1 Tax=Rhodomicrobium sp. TaxID=2720632 RepID=UPI0039E56ED7